MSSDAKKKAPFYANPMFWGVAGTVVLFIIYGLLAFVVDCDPTGLVCHSKWAQFVSAAPNEIGDTLAGLAGALAFLWIIVTVMLQSQELREQRAEMKLQRAEFEKMVEAQEAQVKALNAQAAVFEDEKRYRNETRNDALMTARLDNLIEKLRIGTYRGLQWQYYKPRDLAISKRKTALTFISKFPEMADQDRLYSEILRQFKTDYNRIKLACERNEISSKPWLKKEFSDVILLYQGIVEIQTGCSKAVRERMDKIALQKLGDILEELAWDREIWSGTGDRKNDHASG